MFLLVRHLLVLAWHLFLVASLVSTSKALVTSSDALVPSAFFAGPPSVDAPVVRGYFGVGAESGTRSSRFECKAGRSKGCY